MTRQQKRADRINAKAAEAAPLAALMGIIPQVTVETLDQKKADALAHIETREAWNEGKEQVMRAELLMLVGANAFDQWRDWHHVGEDGYVGWYMALSWALQKARKGEAIYEPWLPEADRARAVVDVEAAFIAVAAWPKGCSVSEVAEKVGGTVLDTANALLSLRESGRVQTREMGGWRVVV